MSPSNRVFSIQTYSKVICNLARLERDVIWPSNCYAEVDLYDFWCRASLRNRAMQAELSRPKVPEKVSLSNDLLRAGSSPFPKRERKSVWS